jgi:excisionase family DNA binding protein
VVDEPRGYKSKYIWKEIIRMEEMMNIREVCNVLGVSPATVIDLVAAGDLSAYRVLGTQVDKESVSNDSRGLRFKPSDLREYLSKVLIK